MGWTLFRVFQSGFRFTFIYFPQLIISRKIETQIIIQMTDFILISYHCFITSPPMDTIRFHLWKIFSQCSCITILRRDQVSFRLIIIIIESKIQMIVQERHIKTNIKYIFCIPTQSIRHQIPFCKTWNKLTSYNGRLRVIWISRNITKTSNSGFQPHLSIRSSDFKEINNLLILQCLHKAFFRNNPCNSTWWEKSPTLISCEIIRTIITEVSLQQVLISIIISQTSHIPNTCSLLSRSGVLLCRCVSGKQLVEIIWNKAISRCTEFFICRIIIAIHSLDFEEVSIKSTTIFHTSLQCIITPPAICQWHFRWGSLLQYPGRRILGSTGFKILFIIIRIAGVSQNFKL